MDLPTLEETGSVEREVSALLPWLPDPHRCDCGSLCKSTKRYSGNMGEYVDAWECPDCSKTYHRERE